LIDKEKAINTSLYYTKKVFNKSYIFILFFLIGYFIYNPLYQEKSINLDNKTKENIVIIDPQKDVEFVLSEKNTKKKDSKSKKQEEYKKQSIYEKIKYGDSLYLVLTRNGITPTEVHYISEKIKELDKSYLNLKVGEQVRVNKINNIISSVDIFNSKTDFMRILFDEENNFTVYEDTVPTEINYAYKKGIIKNSFYLDGVNAGLSDQQIYELANVFAWDVDFTRDIREGNAFKVVYEEKIHNDKVVDTGKILAAYIETQRGNFYAIGFDYNNEFNYYDLNGNNVEKAFLKSPVKLERITSKFTLKRFHPILKINRPHRGVDYGGHKGTPIMATGDGKIIKRRKERAYGNVIMIDHGKGYKTLYAHMNRFNNNFKSGSKVKQGDVIGYMGTTGLSTGVHLHYEMRLYGEYKDPLTLDLPDGEPVPNKKLFEIEKNKLLEILKQ